MRSLEPFLARPGAAGVFLDFDGTLSEIVERPELARAVPGALEALERLAGRVALVAIVTGRPAHQVETLLGARGVEIFGLYGLEAHADARDGDPRVERVLPFAEQAAAVVPGAWVERKGLSLAVHYREALDPDAAGAALGARLRDVAERHGLQLVEGKKVLELAAGRPSKGDVVENEARRRRLGAVLYAGDDLADVDAFAALERLAVEGTAVLRVAVRGAETPPELQERADTVVDGPIGLVRLLDEFAGG